MSKTDWQEVKSSTISFGKVGDYVEGTLTDIKVREVRDEKKGLIKKNVYEIMADEGSYHATDAKRNPIEPAIICKKGDYYDMWGGKDIIDGGMRKAKIGQKVKALFAEEGEPRQKGYSGFKVIKIYVGPMDDAWLENKEVNMADVEY